MDTPIALRMAGELRAEMARQRMSGRRLAQSVDMYPSLLSRRLASPENFTVDELEQVCAALGLTLRELVDRATVKAA